MKVLEGLEPQSVFYYFEKMCEIPHGTHDTKRISDFCVEFAKERGLEVYQDEVNNVIIYKPGTPGYEDSDPVILQGHLDMVCEKTIDSDHDFTRDGLKLYIEDGFVCAKDTTLGGDDGIAVAMALAVLDSKEISHPPIEALFTVDEEEGMDGAQAIDFSKLKGKMLINIDSEDEGILTAGCAGGVRFETVIPIEREIIEGRVGIKVEIGGLLGGHSGIEIHKQRGNANILAGRLLNHLSQKMDIRLVSMKGGSKNNVITFNNITKIAVKNEDEELCLSMIKEFEETILQEFGTDEPDLKVTVSNFQCAVALKEESTQNIIYYLIAVPNGPQCFERAIEGQVETSLNLGVAVIEDDAFHGKHLIRSSMESKKMELKETMMTIAKMVHGTGSIGEEYPAWSYRKESHLRDTMVQTYKDMFNRELVIDTIHAGLECGLFLGKEPSLDCVSIGPQMYDVHSVNERLEIASVTRTYTYLLEVLKRLK